MPNRPNLSNQSAINIIRQIVDILNNIFCNERTRNICYL
jgi:hypothetical protein